MRAREGADGKRKKGQKHPGHKRRGSILQCTLKLCQKEVG